MNEGARWGIIGMFIAELFILSFADSCTMNKLHSTSKSSHDPALLR